MKKNRRILYLQIIISLILLSCSTSEITVSIVGESLEKSNEVIGISIHEIADSLEGARTSVEGTYETIEAALIDLDIDTESISIRGSNSGEKEGEYFVTKELQIVIPKDTDMDVLLERVTLAGAAGVHSAWGILGPDIQDSDLPFGYENVLEAARVKAEAIAAASGRSIGKILSIEEMNNYGDTVMFRISYELR